MGLQVNQRDKRPLVDTLEGFLKQATPKLPTKIDRTLHYRYDIPFERFFG
jgi:hypothetical protein